MRNLSCPSTPTVTGQRGASTGFAPAATRRAVRGGRRGETRGVADGGATRWADRSAHRIADRPRPEWGPCWAAHGRDRGGLCIRCTHPPGNPQIVRVTHESVPGDRREAALPPSRALNAHDGRLGRCYVRWAHTDTAARG